MYETEMEELFREWERKENHSGAIFNRDGIVDCNEWGRGGPRILFLLKEAYHSEDFATSSYDLAEDLRQNGPWGNVWRRVAEWTYGIIEASKGYAPSYRRLNDAEAAEMLRKIAVVNVKKSHGRPRSEEADLMEYVRADRELLCRQIELIDPEIIICGYTMEYFNEIISSRGEHIDRENERSENWHYRWRDKIVLDYYHPAVQYPALMSFYGIVGCYRDAMREA